MLPPDTFEAVVQATVAALVNKSERTDCFDAFGDMLIRMITGRDDVEMHLNDEPADYLQTLRPKKEE